MTAATAAAATPATDTTQHASMDVVRTRHYGRGILSVVLVLLALQIVWALGSSENIRWDIVGEFLFSGAILTGLGTTLQITVLSMICSLLIAVPIAVGRMSASRIISSLALGYVFIFRGIPLIVLLILVGNLGLFVERIWIGIPFTDITFFSAATSSVVTPLVASVLGLSLSASAYMAEIVRGGILAVDRGQHQAAMALGLTKARTLSRIVLPQALRVIIPPMGNEFINVLKVSALVSIIAGGDLLTVALGIAGVNFRTIEMMFVATFWYLAIFLIYTIAQAIFEKKVAAR